MDYKSNYNSHHFHLEDIDFNKCKGTDIVQFGVFSGDSLYSILKKAQDIPIPYIRKVFGIDSFCGLKLKDIDLVNHSDWYDGNFDARKLFNEQSPQKVAQLLEKMFQSFNYDITMIPMWFDQLNLLTINQYDIQKAFYIDIDCDLYSSTKEALEFIFDNDLLAQYGLIRYDDYHAVTGGGECLAHKQLKNVSFKYLGDCVFKYLGNI